MSTYDGLPPYDGRNVNSWMLRLQASFNAMLNGKTNNVDSVTLNTSTATTTVVLAKGRLGPDTYINFMPLTQNAASELAAGTMWVSTIDSLNNKFHITNASNMQADRTFRFILVG